MITLHNQIDIDRPIADVFDFIANVENAPKWQPAVIETTRITDGPIRVGTQFREVAKFMGRNINTICEITEIEPLKRFAFKGTSNGPASYQSTYTLESIGNATRITIVGHFQFKGLWRLLEPFIKGEVGKESAQELKEMKAAIESRK
jgi:carbon monoxide dehydrogenase subunit G